MMMIMVLLLLMLLMMMPMMAHRRISPRACGIRPASRLSILVLCALARREGRCACEEESEMMRGGPGSGWLEQGPCSLRKLIAWI